MKIKEYYNKDVALKMKEEFGYKNIMAVPKMEKVTLNITIMESLIWSIMRTSPFRITG